jgi:hypothetical protein
MSTHLLHVVVITNRDSSVLWRTTILQLKSVVLLMSNDPSPVIRYTIGHTGGLGRVLSAGRWEICKCWNERIHPKVLQGKVAECWGPHPTCMLWVPGPRSQVIHYIKKVMKVIVLERAPLSHLCLLSHQQPSITKIIIMTPI